MGWEATIAAVQSLVGKEVRVLLGEHETFPNWVAVRGELRALVDQGGLVALKAGEGGRRAAPPL